MLNKTKDAHSGNGAISSGSQTKSLDNDPRKKNQEYEADAETGESNIVVNEEEQNRVLSHSTPKTKQEQSFYKNDLPEEENEEGTDVDEQSPKIKPEQNY